MTFHGAGQHSAGGALPPPSRPTKPGYWPLFGAGVCAGIGSLVTGFVLFFASAAVLLSDELSGLDDISRGDAMDLIGNFAAAIAVSLVLNFFVTALLLKWFTSAFTRFTVPYGAALAAAALGMVAWFGGLLLDALVLGMSLGLIGLLSFAAASAFLLQRMARPDR